MESFFPRRRGFADVESGVRFFLESAKVVTDNS